MATMRCVFTCSLLIASSVYAQSSFSPVPRAGVLLDLLGAAPADSAPSLAVRQAPSEGRKAPGLAAVFSLILPGMGELYAGDFSSGRYFLGGEGVLWLTYAAFEVYGDALRNDARLYAVTYAGVNPAGKSDQFYVDVGNFLDVQQYNDKKLRDRTPSLLYDPSAGYAWQWGSDAERQAFRDMRVHSENMFNNKKFVGAAILINHVASAINAARAAIAHNAAARDLLGDMTLSASVIGTPGAPQGIMLTLTRGF